MPDRRAFLRVCAGLLAAPAWVRAAVPASPAPVSLAAAWQTEAGYQVGILAPADSGLRIRTAIDVPSRAHALLQEPGGSLLAIARRPGDWLLRWDRQGRPLAWRWIEPHRAFTGHVVGDGERLYVTETDLESGAGLIGVRDAQTLEKLAEWPTHGIDPHQLVWDARLAGALIVANGGVPTRPETGRLKRDLERMDSSLVRIDAASGAMLDQWRLDDRRLSLRHLTWQGERLGIALQAEHDSADARAAAPVLALFDGDSLRPVAAPQALSGYGGDIVSTRVSSSVAIPAADEPGFAVSCPRAQGIALFAVDGGWRGLIPLAEACALATSAQGIWAGGRWQALTLSASQASDAAPISGIRLDNHWIMLN